MTFLLTLKSMQFFYTKARSRLNEVLLHKYESKLIFAFFAVKTRMNRIARKSKSLFQWFNLVHSNQIYG